MDQSKRVYEIKTGEDVILPLTIALAECFCRYFKELTAFAISDIPGEDHVFARDEQGKAMFDLLVSTGRKFVFLWYYIHPTKGMDMVDEMKQITLATGNDFGVKYPNVPVKTGYPCIVRYGKKPAGNPQKFIDQFRIKSGNPQLEETIYTEENLNTYRNYSWSDIKDPLKKILVRSKEMMAERLSKKHPEKMANVRGYCLYAGCAYSYCYPELGFGMRDIDVNAFFSPDWFINARCAFTRHCGIPEFGEPEYFGSKTRWLDLMFNSFHTETGNFKEDVVTYMSEMRMKSDRWSTMSQRPFIDLATEEIIYIPNWLHKLKDNTKE